MSDRCANILLKIVIGIGLVLVFAGFMSQKVFAQAVESPAETAPASQPAVADDQKSDATSDSASLPFGKKDGKSPLGTLPNNGPDTSGLLRQMLALVVIILVLGGGCWFVMKKGFPRFGIPCTNRPGEITLLETKHIPPRQKVHLLQVGAKRLLLASGKDGLSLLADVTDGFPEKHTDEEFQDVLEKQDVGRNEGQS